MTKVEVNSRICGHKSLVTAELEGKVVRIQVESTCENVSRFGSELQSLTVKDLLSFDSRVFVLASESRMHPTCLNICGIFNAARIEAKLIAKSLALKEKEISIRFLE